NSNRQRTDAEIQILRESGSRIAAYSLKGKMVFTTTEVVVRDVTEKMDGMDYLILDFKRVQSVNESSCRLLLSLALNLFESGKMVLLTHTGNAPNLLRFIKVKLGEKHGQVFKIFDDTDFALEWCENRLIEERLPAHSVEGGVSPADYEILNGLGPDELAVVAGMLERRSDRKGDVIIKSGDEADDLFFLARGSVSVWITLASGRQRRLATLSPGMVFGEMAVIDGARRSAEVLADDDAECDLLKVADFNLLVDTYPRIKIVILKNLNLAFCRKLRKANRELSIFDN
ncbi:MAG: cyclic nucleotide-binding domain-containing protein, partial [Verrucomicrobiota bacterium]